MAINDTSLLAAIGSAQGEQMVHTLHFRHLAPPAPGELMEQTLIDQWQAAAQSQFLAQFGNSFTLDRILARQVCGTVPLRATVEETVGLTGSKGHSGAITAPWLAGLVRERTALTGRTRQGRYFIWVDDEANINGKTISTAFQTTMQTYANALLTAFGPSGTNTNFRLVVHSRKLAATPGTQCQDSSTLVTNLAASNVLTTNRSRRSRTGV